MKTYYILLLLAIFPMLSCSVATERDNNGPKPVQSSSLPDDPCEVLNSAQMSAITGLEVTSVNRAPSLAKVVLAQRENREPGPGAICIYETRSEFGAILVAVPARADRRAAEYWEARAKYFETFPGAAQPVEGLGMDAWLSGGAALHVLARGDEHFTVSTQMHHPRSRELLVNVAKVVLGQL